MYNPIRTGTWADRVRLGAANPAAWNYFPLAERLHDFDPRWPIAMDLMTNEYEILLGAHELSGNWHPNVPNFQEGRLSNSHYDTWNAVWRDGSVHAGKSQQAREVLVGSWAFLVTGVDWWPAGRTFVGSIGALYRVFILDEDPSDFGL